MNCLLHLAAAAFHEVDPYQPLEARRSVEKTIARKKPYSKSQWLGLALGFDFRISCGNFCLWLG